MARCGTCSRVVDGNAPVCPGCGRQNPGLGQDEAIVVAAGFIIFLFLALFMVPALLVIWPTADNLQDAFTTAINSPKAWIGSAMFWGVIVYAVLVHRTKNKARAQLNMPFQQMTGRDFRCYNCRKCVREPVLGVLNSVGVICPFCRAQNVMKTQ